MESEANSPPTEVDHDERPASRRSFIEDEAAEMSMIAADLEEADKFDLTIEYVEKPAENLDEAETDPTSSQSSSESAQMESCDENIELEDVDEKTSPIAVTVASVKKPNDKRKSIAMELLRDWKPSPEPKADRKRKSAAPAGSLSTPKRKVLIERRSLQN